VSERFGVMLIGSPVLVRVAAVRKLNCDLGCAE